jgi:tetratricopeptide (TPR) repeat protein
MNIRKINAQTWLTQAKQYEEKDDFASAITVYERTLIYDDANKAECLFQLGMLYRNKAAGQSYDRDLKQAIKYFEQASKLFPDNIDKAHCYYNCALSYKKLGGYGLHNAICDFDIARKLYSEDIDKAECLRQIMIAHQMQGCLSTVKDNATQVIITCTKALEQLNRSFFHKKIKAECYFNRANAHQYLKEYDLAIIDYETAVRYDSKIAHRFSTVELVYWYQLEDLIDNRPDFYEQTLKHHLSDEHRKLSDNYLERREIAQASRTSSSARQNTLSNAPPGTTVFSPKPSISPTSAKSSIDAKNKYAPGMCILL